MPLILGTNSIKDTGYNVANSLRFNDGSSDYLSRTPSSTGNKQTWTYSAWIKRGTSVASTTVLLGAYLGGSNRYSYIGFSSSEHGQDEIQLFSGNYTTGSSTSIAFWVNTNNIVYRDFSAWYHIVVSCDLTESSAGDVLKVYVNNVLQTTGVQESNATVPNDSTFFNTSGIAMQVGSLNAGSFFDGYMAEVCWIDGTALTPTSFGEFDSDSPTIWKPKDVSGLTFGTNGFYLEFEQSGTSQNSSGLGADTSGNDNHFAVNNLTAVDQSIDTCTNNFATMNPLAPANISSASEGNLKILQSSSGGSVISTFGFSSGKWYWEVELDSQVTYTQLAGVIKESKMESALLSSFNVGANDGGWGYFLQSNTDNGKAFHNNSASSAYTTMSAGNILSIAVDSDNGKIYFAVNGTYVNSGDPANGTGAVYTNLPTGENLFPAITNYLGTGSGTPTLLMNFGSPSFAISSGNTDGNGFGNFEYAVPSGYFSLCTKNLAEFG
jgi:hypothetical protein